MLSWLFSAPFKQSINLKISNALIGQKIFQFDHQTYAVVQCFVFECCLLNLLKLLDI